MKRGFTWMEFLVALTVLAVVAALVYPLARGVLEQMWKQGCMHNLGQIGQAVVAYREEWDGIGKYGAPWAMGLPAGPREAYPKEEKKQYPECPRNPRWGLYVDMYPPYSDEPWAIARLKYFWLPHVKKMKERAVIFMCPDHWEPKSQYDRQFALGLLLGGEVVARWGWLDPYWYPAFWED